MRLLLVLTCVTLACSSQSHSLDKFDHAIEFAGLGCPERELYGTRWTCHPVIAEYPSCPCEAELELVASKDGRDLMEVHYSVRHCKHQVAVSANRYLIDWFPVKDLDAIFEQPSQNATAQSARATYVRGERVLDVEWTREAYRTEDGKIQPQDLESYLVAIHPRRDGERERIATEDQPTVVKRQKCPGD